MLRMPKYIAANSFFVESTKHEEIPNLSADVSFLGLSLKTCLNIINLKIGTRDQNSFVEGVSRKSQQTGETNSMQPSDRVLCFRRRNSWTA